MSMSSPDGGAVEGTGIHKKVGPLQVWQWAGVAALGALGFLWWRSRNGSDSGSVDNADDGYATDDMNSGDYASGYDYGYAAGLNASGSGGGTTTVDTGGNAKGPIAHNRFQARVKDPAGKMENVVGYGTWVHGAGGKGWKWQPGIPKQFSLLGNGTTGAGTSAATAAAVQPSDQVADDGTGQTAMSDAATTLDQATGTAGAATSGGTTSPPAGSTTPPSSGTTGPKQTATNAQKIAQIIKDLQNPGPKYTAATQKSQLQEYKTLTGHAYTGKLGPLQVGQQVGYATV
jgi:hypothetical protein